MSFYKDCPELTRCKECDKYYIAKDYKKCFEGYLKIAEETSYFLAECQVGFFYLDGLGVEKDLEKAFYWTYRGAIHGDRDAMCNLADIFYIEGLFVNKDMEKAIYWYKKAAECDHDLAIAKLKELNA